MLLVKINRLRMQSLVVLIVGFGRMFRKSIGKLGFRPCGAGMFV